MKLLPVLLSAFGFVMINSQVAFARDFNSAFYECPILAIQTVQDVCNWPGGPNPDLVYCSVLWNCLAAAGLWPNDPALIAAAINNCVNGENEFSDEVVRAYSENFHKRLTRQPSQQNIQE